MFDKIGNILGTAVGWVEDAGEFILELPGEIRDVGEKAGDLIFGGVENSDLADTARNEGRAHYEAKTGADLMEWLPLIAIGGVVYLALKK